MGFMFTDIYTKAIALFDDPKITMAYASNMIQFDKLMYTYLQNAIGLFDNPLGISMRLSMYNPPIGTTETFEGNGQDSTFQLDENFELLDNCLYGYMEGDNYVEGVLNVEDRTVTFPNVLPEGQVYSFEQYFPGEFLDEFEDFNVNAPKGNNMVLNRIKDILARLLIKAWGEEERNFLLDIRNLMQDSDFKIMSNDRILNSKNKWIAQLTDEIQQYQNRLAWTIRFMNGSYNIGRG